MLIEIPPLRPRRGARKARRVSPGPAPAPVAPVLVSATWDTSDGAVLTLTFDRDVAIVSFNPAAVLVWDEPGEQRYDGGAGAFVIGPNVVRVEMTVIEVIPSGPDVLLSATGASGIVAAEGGTAWAGVTDVELPYT